MSDVGVTLGTGLALGAAYALIGVAVSAVALATRTLHLAVGQILVVGVLVRLALGVQEVVGLPDLVAVAAGLAAAAALSAALEPLVLARLRPGLAWLVGLVVAAAVIEVATARWLGARTYRPQPLLGGSGSVDLAGVTVPEAVVPAIVLGLPGALLLAWAVRRTRWGRRLRLVGGSTDAAAQLGISPGRTRAGALAVGGVVSVLAGLLVAPIVFVGVGQGATFTVRGVAAAALFGRGGPGRTVPGGLALGLVEALAQRASPRTGAELGVAVLVLAVLVIRGSEGSRAWGRTW